MCSPAPTAGRCEERTKVKGEGRSERSRSKSRLLLTPTYSVPTRDALRASRIMGVMYARELVPENRNDNY